MQIVSSGGTMDALKAKPAATSTLEHYSPKELAGFLNALWDDQAHWPIPTDIRWEDFAPEKVMLRFKEELQRLQPYVEGWFSERGKSLPDWPKIYFVPVEGWLDYFNGHPDRTHSRRLDCESCAHSFCDMSLALYAGHLSLCPKLCQGALRIDPQGRHPLRSLPSPAAMVNLRRDAQDAV